MVIFEDLRKLLLYQKLNLGFECNLCKKKFYNRIDHLEHTSSCRTGPGLKCPKCGKAFGHFRILQLHLRLHNLSESTTQQSPDVVKTERPIETLVPIKSGGLETNNVHKEETATSIKVENSVGESSVNTISSILERDNSASNLSVPFNLLKVDAPKKSSHKVKENPKQGKKRVGLTKIKMEDCLRCDACSCIYIDEKDYYKHMRNFHQRDMNNAPIKQPKAKKKCRSCCKQCRGSHCTSVKRPRATQRASNLIFRLNMKDNIQSRWTQMVSQQSSDCPMPESSVPPEPEFINIKPDPDAIPIKQEPEADLSYLLSQVEVKIKTEPLDEY